MSVTIIVLTYLSLLSIARPSSPIPAKEGPGTNVVNDPSLDLTPSLTDEAPIYTGSGNYNGSNSDNHNETLTLTSPSVENPINLTMPAYHTVCNFKADPPSPAVVPAPQIPITGSVAHDCYMLASRLLRSSGICTINVHFEPSVWFSLNKCRFEVSITEDLILQEGTTERKRGLGGGGGEGDEGDTVRKSSGGGDGKVMEAPSRRWDSKASVPHRVIGWLAQSVLDRCTRQRMIMYNGMVSTRDLNTVIHVMGIYI